MAVGSPPRVRLRGAPAPRTLPAPPAPAESVGWAWTGACAAGFLALCVLLRDFVTDDAWITVRYAENLANGHGFVWNPGGPRVEGFSNPLLVGVEAVAHAAGLSATGAARGLGVLSGLALLAVLRSLGPAVAGATATRVALLLTALSPPMALWAVGGLETLPAALAATAGVLWLLRGDAIRGGAALATLPWLRPEGLAIAVAVAVAAEGPGLLRRAQRRRAARRLLLAAGIPIASQAALLGMRLAVYGHVLPNSALYKSGRGITFEVLERFALQAAPVLAVAAVALLLARGRTRLLAVPVLVYAAGSVGMLDSVNSYSRLFLPVWPLLALLAGVTVAVAHRRLGRHGAAVAVGLALFLTAHGALAASDVRAFTRHYASCNEAARAGAAGWLRTRTAPGTVYSISDAGLVPLRAGDRTAVDQLRLNEAQLQVAGRRPLPEEVDQVYDARPEVLVLASTDPERLQGRYAADRTMAADTRFPGYSLAHVARGGGPGCRYHLFVYRLRARP